MSSSTVVLCRFRSSNYALHEKQTPPRISRHVNILNMTKQSTKPISSINLTTLSLGVLVVASIVLGILMSSDQSYSPLPSVNGLVTTLIILVACGGFVAYASFFRLIAKSMPWRLTHAIITAVGATIAGLLVAYLVRMILVI